MSAASLLCAALVLTAGGLLFSSAAVPLTAAGILITMPLVMLGDHAATAHWWQATALLASATAVSHGRTGTDRRWLAVAGAIVGGATAIGAASLIVMPGFAVAILLLILIDEPRSERWRDAAMFGGALVMTSLPSLIWLSVNPDNYRERVLAYGLYDAQRYNVAQGAREVFSWVGVTARSEIYWHYFEPGWLFLSGRVFLLPLAVIMPLGIARVLAEPPSARWLLIAGLVLAPAVASLLGHPQVPERFLLAAPFAALLAAAGLVGALRSEPRWQRLVGVILGGWLLIEGAVFLAR